MFGSRKRFLLSTILVLLLAAPVALAGSRIERELELAPGGRFTLDTDGGSVRVTGGSGSAVMVEITADRDDIEDFNKRIQSVNLGLADLKRLVGEYMRTRKVNRPTDDPVDLSEVDVSAETLSQIYNLIEQDPKAGREEAPKRTPKKAAKKKK